jgi:hypothetical protein
MWVHQARKIQRNRKVTCARGQLCLGWVVVVLVAVESQWVAKMDMEKCFLWNPIRTWLEDPECKD